jgi:Trk K+ transport system NAD-binding subunit
MNEREPGAGHFIVCGLGQVGSRAALLLRRLGEEVVVVTEEARADVAEAVARRGVRIIRGDARQLHRHPEVSLATAKGLLVLTDRDLVNIEVAIDARAVRPDLPIVMRLFDQTLAKQLEASFSIRRADAMSALSAPSFAAAVLMEEVLGSFTIEARSYVIGRIATAPGSALHGARCDEVPERFGLAVLAHQTEDGRSRLFPPSETLLDGGDRVTVMGSTADWDRATPDFRRRRTKSQLRSWVGLTGRMLRPSRWWEMLGKIWLAAPPPLRSWFVLLNAFLLAAVFVFRYALKISMVEAFYFMTTTVATIGYGDITPRHAGPIVLLFACVTMMASMATLAVFYSIITDFIVANRVEQMMGSQTVPEGGHVIVVGMGNVGFRIIEELRRMKVTAVAIERDADGDFAEVVRPATPVIIGDARARETLERAGAADAHAVIAATDDDAVNLSVSLAAKELNPKTRTVVRFFDADFAAKVQAALNVDVAMSAAAIAVPTFVGAALAEDSRVSFVTGSHLVTVVERAAASPGGECRVLMQARAGEGFRPVSAGTGGGADRVLGVIVHELRE